MTADQGRHVVGPRQVDLGQHGMDQRAQPERIQRRRPPRPSPRRRRRRRRWACSPPLSREKEYCAAAGRIGRHRCQVLAARVRAPSAAICRACWTSRSMSRRAVGPTGFAAGGGSLVVTFATASAARAIAAPAGPRIEMPADQLRPRALRPSSGAARPAERIR